MNKKPRIVRTGDDKAWPKKAFKADSKAWRVEYDRVFRENIKRNPGWDKARKTGQVSLNNSQSRALEWVQKKAKPGSRILDVGCGPGFLTMALNVGGHEAYGCDLSPEAIKFCKETTKQDANRFFVSSVEGLADHKNTYDLVICNQVLEHLKDPEAAISILWDLVKEGGMLLVGVPNGEDFDIPYHLHFFTEKNLHRLTDPVSKLGDYPMVSQLFGIENTNITFWLIDMLKVVIDKKYVQVVGTPAEANTANDVIQHTRIKTGVFNWGRLYHGKSVALKDLGDPNDYDVVHVHLSGTNFQAPSTIRAQLRGGNTRLVVTPDYAPEYMYMYPPFPDLLIQQLQCADHITTVEPQGALLLSQVTGRKVTVIPHPADIDAIKSFSKPKEKRGDALVLTHRDQYDYLPYWILRGSGLYTRVIGRLAPLSNSTGSVIEYPALMYDQVDTQYHGGHKLVSNVMSSALIAVDAYTHHVCGRSAIELAALGIPTIGFDNVWAQAMCFPQTTVPHGHVADARHMVAQLLDPENDFYRMVSEQAQEKVEYFSINNARERMNALLEEDPDAGEYHARQARTSVGPEVETVRPSPAADVGQPAEPLGDNETGSGSEQTVQPAGVDQAGGE